MAQNNLLKPSLLGQGASENQNPQNSNATNMTPELEVIVSGMIERAINAQGREILTTLLSQGTEGENNVDQVIDDRYRSNLTDLDRIPDVVRCLKEFSGNKSEFSSWKKNVERILNIYEATRGTPKYFGILSVIRNKIIGDADIVLESYNTPLNWCAIAKCLTLHYADKRDIGTLEYQLTTLIQGNNSIEEFYKNVYSHLSLILNKVSCLEASTEAVSLLTQNYRNKALDTFIRGLNGNLSQLLAVREPVDLPQALNLCTKLRNQNFRSFHVNNAFKSNQRAPDLPPRKSGNIPQQQQQQQQQPYGQQVFYPQLAYLPQHSNQWSQARNQHTGRYGNGEPQRLHQPFARPPMVPQIQQNPVEPMEVDQSMQTRRVDYMNRPNYNGFRGKRPASSYNVGPGKQQRTFHLNNDLQEVSEDNNNNYTRNTTTVNSNEMLNMEEEINYDNYE